MPRKLFAIMLCALVSPIFMGSRPMDAPLASPPLNVILLIGDGMGLGQITAGMIANGNHLNLERFHNIGFIKTHCADQLITDSAAGATAFACGQKTNYGYIGLDTKQNPLPTILEIAHRNQLATGLVGTNYIQHATTAAFFAHHLDRNNYDEISLDLLRGAVDIAIGGGRRFFEDRKDGLAIEDSLQSRGYELFTNLRKARKATGERIIVTAAKEHLPTVTEGRGDFLAQASLFTIERLKPREGNFFMVIEGGQIDFGGHSNDKAYIISEMIDFDKTIGAVLDFAEADGNTLVIVTADHETGGMSIEDGNLKTKEVVTDFTSARHTGTLIPVFAYGPGSEKFGGIYENTEIFFKMMEALGLTL